MGKHSAVSRESLAECLSLAHLLLRRRGILEFCRRRTVRIPDQSTDRALLHARSEHDAGSRPYSSVRRIRNAWHWSDVVLSAGTAAWTHMERVASEILVLVYQHRTFTNGPAQSVAHRPHADMGL